MWNSHSVYDRNCDVTLKEEILYKNGVHHFLWNKNLITITQKENQYDIIVEKYNPNIHNQDDIYGRAPFTDGLTELKFRPGLYTKLGYCFEYAPIFENMKALEVGVALDAFPKEIPIMAFTKNKQLFFTFYITLMYGRKW